jgi:hypothetical protein
MSSQRDARDRLLALGRILSGEPGSPSPGADIVSLHLSAVAADRIRELSAALETAHAGDEVDALAMRLLLNDYAAAVGHLRAVARAAAHRIDEAALPVREAQLFMKREARRDERSAMKRAQPLA